MKRLIALGVSIVLCAELAALSLHDRRLVLWLAGAAVLFALINVRQVLGRDIEPPPPENPNALEETLRSWLSRTQTLIHRSEATRADWDRHLRPMLARRFAIATGQKTSKGPGSVRRHGPNAFRPRAVGVGAPQQRFAHRCERTRTGPRDARGNPGTA